jgi:hypothetical protein
VLAQGPFARVGRENSLQRLNPPPGTPSVIDKMRGKSEARSAALENLRAGHPVLSLGVRISRTTDIARLARSSGYGVLWVDLEHSSTSTDSAAQILASAFDLGLEAWVRRRRSRAARGALACALGEDATMRDEILTTKPVRPARSNSPPRFRRPPNPRRLFGFD